MLGTVIRKVFDLVGGGEMQSYNCLCGKINWVVIGIKLRWSDFELILSIRL